MSCSTSSRVKKQKTSDHPTSMSKSEVNRLLRAATTDSVQFSDTFKNENPSSLVLFLESLTTAELERVWKRWFEFANENYLEQRNEPKNKLNALSCAIHCAKHGLSSSLQRPIPSGLIELSKLCNQIIITEDDIPQLRNNACHLCEKWYSERLPDAETFCVNIAKFLLKKNLENNYSNAITKRLLGLSEFFNSRDDETLKEELKETFRCREYLSTLDGINFWALIGGRQHFLLILHEIIKESIPGSSSKTAVSMGEVYKRIWLKHEDIRETIEDSCIQDLMYHGALANRSLPKTMEILGPILSFLEPFHSDKNSKPIQSMLFRLWEPILWRNLNVANPIVRANAAEFLFRAFPIENPFQNLEERALQHDSQIKAMSDLLGDDDAVVRLVAVKGVCQILSKYWLLLSSESINQLMGRILRDLGRDPYSSAVRLAVVRGIRSILVKNHRSRLYFKTLLPQLSSSLHDIKDGVRLAMIELLLAVKSIKSIMYWEVCPLEDILFRLASDKSHSVCRNIVKLLYDSFFPVKETESVKLERCFYLISQDPIAARRFYEFSDRLMKIEEAVKFMLSILASFKKHLKIVANDTSILDDSEASKENLSIHSQVQTSKMSDIVEQDEQQERDTSYFADPKMMENLLDIITVVWIVRSEELVQDDNVKYRAVLEKKTSKIMTSMFKLYKDSEMCGKIIYLSSLFSRSSVNVILKHCLSTLRHFEPVPCRIRHCESAILSWRGKIPLNGSDRFCIFIDAVCNWGRGDEFLELISEWIKEGLRRMTRIDPACKRRKKGVRFSTCPLNDASAVSFLTYVLRHSVNKELLIKKNLSQLKDIHRETTQIWTIVKEKLRSKEQDDEEETIFRLWELNLKLDLLLNDVIDDEYLTWLEQHFESLSTSSINLVRTTVLYLSNAFSLSKQPNNGSMARRSLTFASNVFRKTKHAVDAYLASSLLAEILEWSSFMDDRQELIRFISSEMDVVLESMVIESMVVGIDEISNDFKIVLISILDSYRRFNDQDSYYDIIKVFVNTSLLGLVKNDVEPPSKLPGSVSLIVNTVNAKARTITDFLYELRISLQMGLNGQSEYEAAAHLLNVLSLDDKCKAERISLKDCVNELEARSESSEILREMKSRLGLIV